MTDTAGKRPNTRNRRKDPTRESLRWFRGVVASESPRALHVMDREGDNFDLLAPLSEQGYRFVIRSNHNRNLVGARKLRNALSRKPVLLQREVWLGSRGPRKIKSEIHPPRQERKATLAVRAGTVELVRPSTFAEGVPSTLAVNVVMVTEPRPPTGEQPVEWFLLTNEPIDTDEQVEAIVDAYRARWLVEEFFKALKTGCLLERRQLESFNSIRVALGIFLPIAVQLLGLRTEARLRPNERSNLLTPAQLRVLAIKTKRPLTTASTHLEISDALARLGGHLKGNGAPGWIVLGRALNKLIVLAEGWETRESAETSDLS